MLNKTAASCDELKTISNIISDCVNNGLNAQAISEREKITIMQQKY